MLPNLGLVLRQTPPSAHLVATWDRLASGAEPARARRKEDDVKGSLLEQVEERVVVSDAEGLRVAEHRRKHLARALRHLRIAASNQDRLLACVTIRARRAAVGDLVHHAVSRRVRHARAQCRGPHREERGGDQPPRAEHTLARRVRRGALGGGVEGGQRYVGSLFMFMQTL